MRITFAFSMKYASLSQISIAGLKSSCKLTPIISEKFNPKNYKYKSGRFKDSYWNKLNVLGRNK